MTNYQVILNYQREVTKMKTEAPGPLQALLNCLQIMAKKYRVSNKFMVRYFSNNKLNYEVMEIKGDKCANLSQK
jgi:hypothetical protein